MAPDIPKAVLPVFILLVFALFLTGYLSFNYMDFRLEVGFGYMILVVIAFIGYFLWGGED